MRVSVEDCTFCKIIRGEQPADFLYQDESLVVFKDIRPQEQVHLLIGKFQISLVKVY